MAFSAVRLSLKETTYSTISVIWTCNLPNHPDRFCLQLTQADEKREVAVSGSVTAFEITHLSAGLMYKLQVAPIVGSRVLSWSNPLFAQTKPHPNYELLVQSEQLVHEDCGAWREVVMGRRARDWQQYAMSSFKFARPQSHRDVRVKRMMILASAMEVLDARRLEDDYFQGPLYKDNE